MENQKVKMDDRLFQYILSVSLRESAVLKELRMETAKQPHSFLQISPDQGQFMALLVRLMGARRVLEVGTYTGYSALSMALALPADGEVVTLDINKEWTDTAQSFWDKSGVSDKISLKLAPALESMDLMLASGDKEKFDLVFIDADKANYLSYYEKGMQLLRPGGLVLIDNVFWRGKIIDESIQDEDTNALRELNALIYKDDRVEISMVQIGDGMTLAFKKQ